MWNGKIRWFRSNRQYCFHCHSGMIALDDGRDRICTGMEMGCKGLQET